jgi:Ni,Fe-hydrogenase maturation factor
MSLRAVFQHYAAMREQMDEAARPPRIFVVGCVPHTVDEGMELSEPVRAALPACVELVRKLALESAASGAQT